jgi:hypothetical protein
MFARGSDVRFTHPITGVVMASRVYDTCYEGDKSTWTVQVKVGDGCLVWKRVEDCQGAK